MRKSQFNAVYFEMDAHEYASAVDLDIFQMDADDYIDRRCGEVFITKKNNMVMCCSLCSTVYGSFIAFLRHILNDHYEEENDDSLTSSLQLSEKLHHKTTILPERESIEDICIPIECNDYECQDEAMMDDSQTNDQDKEQQFHCVTPASNPESLNIEASTNSVAVLIDEKPEIEKLREIALGIHSCDKCDRVYNSNRQLQIHRRTHDSTDRKHKCEECGFAFKDSGNLRHHIRRHHTKEKRYACPECPKKFYGLSEKVAHLRLHTGERPFVCPVCGKTFKHLSTLNKHNLGHTGVRLYECKLCGKGFNAARRFKEHASVHIGQRNLVCTVCQATFSRADSLRNHMKLHENKREYACTLCDNSFNQRPALLSHLKTRHKVVPTQKE